MQGRDRIEEEDIYSAMENKALEAFSELTNAPKPGQDAGEFLCRVPGTGRDCAA